MYLEEWLLREIEATGMPRSKFIEGLLEDHFKRHPSTEVKMRELREEIERREAEVGRMVEEIEALREELKRLEEEATEKTKELEGTVQTALKSVPYSSPEEAIRDLSQLPGARPEVVEELVRKHWRKTE